MTAKQGDRNGSHEILEQDLAQRWHALPPVQSLPLTGGEVCYLHYAGRSGGPQGPDIRDAVLQFAPAHPDAAEGRITGDVEPSPLDAGRLRTSGKLVEQWRSKGAWETIRQVIMDGGPEAGHQQPLPCTKRYGTSYRVEAG